jgi:uncharacterized protein DUF4440
MKKWFLRVLVALIAFTFSVGLTGVLRFFFGGDSAMDMSVTVDTRPFMDFSDDHAQIAAIYNEYGDAQTRHDRAFFERVETENFVLFVGSHRLSRDEDLQWLEGQPSDISYETRINHIKVLGNSAVARGRMLITYGDGATAEWPFIDVLIKRGNTWQIQSTTASD